MALVHLTWNYPVFTPTLHKQRAGILATTTQATQSNATRRPLLKPHMCILTQYNHTQHKQMGCKQYNTEDTAHSVTNREQLSTPEHLHSRAHSLMSSCRGTVIVSCNRVIVSQDLLARTAWYLELFTHTVRTSHLPCFIPLHTCT